MILYIVRHADPDYEQGTITAAGHAEAEALSYWMAKENIDYVYSSPLGRALHTMKYTTKRLNLPHQVLDWAEEITGMYQHIEGMGNATPFNVPGELIFNHGAIPSHDNWGQNPHFTLHGEQLRNRILEIKQGSDDLMMQHGYQRVDGRYKCVRPNKDKVAVFCHGGLGATWIAHLLHIPISIAWSGIWLAPSSVTTIVMDQRSEQWATPRCISLGETAHLYKADLPVQYRGIPKHLF